jgi:hypothetical protein
MKRWLMCVPCKGLGYIYELRCCGSTYAKWECTSCCGKGKVQQAIKSR